jgi:glucarate dehydratase
MRVAAVAVTPVNVPYKHREFSTQVSRAGVTDLIVRIETDNGVVGWGEACSGADAKSVEAALHAMIPLVIGRDPWEHEAIRADLYQYGLWQFRPTTGNHAWPGLDMALLDICGKDARLPLYRLLGGAVRRDVSYFYYLARDDRESIIAQCRDGLAKGFETFYIKVGIHETDDIRMVGWIREAIGPEARLRIDANGAWSTPQAIRVLHRMAEYDIDFVEQPVRDHPVARLAEVRQRVPMAVAANEGLYTEAEAFARIIATQADVYCFGPYWTGSLTSFQRMAHVAWLQGLQVCKHSHGELGIAAAAAQHVLLTLPNIVEGNQQTAYMMTGDILTEPIPISAGPTWGLPEGPGLGIDVDQDGLAEAAKRYQVDGQFLPYDDRSLMTGRAQ